MIKAGIIGGAGYTGGELIRLLLNHPEVELSFVQSESNAGNKIYSIHHDCFGATDLSFVKTMNNELDVIFLCKGHNESKVFLETNLIPSHINIIDLSQDFRHTTTSKFQDKVFTYGLPELNKEAISTSNYIANPGCFATCIQLALLPLAQQKLIQSDVHINAITGSTGAGQSLSPSTHFSWRNNNHSAYKEFNHQHELEINESIKSLQSNFSNQLNFIPQRGAFTRGIFASTYLKVDKSLEEIENIYSNYYSTHPFTHVVPFDIDVKQVVNTNNCFISIKKHKDTLLIETCIDNLLKGAAGQAVQNLNIQFKLKENAGLNLKPLAF